jgi:hypothetical protein
MSVADSARFMALYSAALTDAYIAVFDAKYHYEFWRPVTAIRNGDIDSNPDTAPDPTWQPIDATPMHPEYPCAHCIESGAAAAVIEATLGSANIPEVTLTSSTAPGVTHRWTNIEAFASEIAEARICAGFHYRFSTRVGAEMGRKIGAYVAANIFAAGRRGWRAGGWPEPRKISFASAPRSALTVAHLFVDLDYVQPVDRRRGLPTFVQKFRCEQIFASSGSVGKTAGMGGVRAFGIALERLLSARSLPFDQPALSALSCRSALLASRWSKRIILSAPPSL